MNLLSSTKRLFSVLTAVGALVTFSSTAQAVIISNATPIPDTHVIINFNGTGLDWVYAGPIAPNEFGAGNIQPASYRAAEGWHFATAGEWAARPTWQDFTRPGFAVPPAAASWTDHSSYRFASEYWGDFSHVDLNDAAAGRLTNGFDIGSLNGVYETWYVRVSANAPSGVPDGGLSAGLFGVALGGMAFLRRRFSR
jgi:hypothetical protein